MVIRQTTYNVEATGWKAVDDMNDETMRFTFPRLDVPADPEKVKNRFMSYSHLRGTIWYHA